MSTPRHDPDRLRVACGLLGKRDSEGVMRTPLPAGEALAAIRAMERDERGRLTAHIDWVLDYESCDMPEASSCLHR